MRANPDISSALVIYNGECEFCKAALAWLQVKNPIEALPFQTAPLTELELTYEECSKQVVLLVGTQKYLGADAIALLLRMRGNKALAAIISLSGPLGRFGYRWIAAHRDSVVVRSWTRILQGKLKRAS